DGTGPPARGAGPLASTSGCFTRESGPRSGTTAIVTARSRTPLGPPDFAADRASRLRVPAGNGSAASRDRRSSAEHSRSPAVRSPQAARQRREAAEPLPAGTL